MELYIDESGNTGCVVNKGNRFNFDNQRHFVLCAITVDNENDKETLMNKYKEFKDKYNMSKEIKGNTLITRQCNEPLDYFVNNVLDCKHMKICVYDKKFYIATMMLVVFLGNEFQTLFPTLFYFLAGELCFFGQDILIGYCELAKNPSQEAFEIFLRKVINHQYIEIPIDKNPLVYIASKTLEKKNYNQWINDILTFGSYNNSNYINVINLNCLSELILALKQQNHLYNSELKIYHDKIDGYDKEMQFELDKFGIHLNIIDSKEELMIQIADNVVSIFSKCFKEVITRIEEKRMWKEDSQWIMEMCSKVIKKIGIENIKFVVPFQNWAAILCVKDMFDEKYLVMNRNNLYFNQMYKDYLFRIIDEMNEVNFDFENSLDILKR